MHQLTNYTQVQYNVHGSEGSTRESLKNVLVKFMTCIMISGYHVCLSLGNDEWRVPRLHYGGNGIRVAAPARTPWHLPGSGPVAPTTFHITSTSLTSTAVLCSYRLKPFICQRTVYVPSSNYFTNKLLQYYYNSFPNMALLYYFSCCI